VLETLLKLLHGGEARPPPLDAAGALSSNAATLVDSVLLPTATWRAGRRLARLRLLAVRALVRLLQGPHADVSPNSDRTIDAADAGVVTGCIGWVPRSAVSTWVMAVTTAPASPAAGGTSARPPGLLPVLLGCLDEDDLALRLETLTAFRLLLGDVSAAHGPDLTAAAIKLVYPELLRRLDDAADAARLAACAALSALARAVAAWHACADRRREAALGATGSESLGYADPASGEFIETRLDVVHWDSILRAVVVHADDPAVEMQAAALATLAEFARLAPAASVAAVDVPLFRERDRIRAVLAAATAAQQAAAEE
ncbi:HEAT repeat-containing protein 2, partial [Cladochytrium tenue]